ncbi:MAG: hypothetical protein AB3N16_10240 [Flavobacteriaceae bacterium]
MKHLPKMPLFATIMAIVFSCSGDDTETKMEASDAEYNISGVLQLFEGTGLSY